MRKLIRITLKSHELIAGEIKQRRESGEVPKPTFESIVQEMTTERQKKQTKKIK
jgi:hypothetical protein